MPDSASDRPSGPRSRALGAAAVFAAACAFDWPVLRNGFAGFDDPMLVVNNPHVRELTWASLRWMFTAFDMTTYQPLGWLLFALIHAAQGASAFGYHAASLALHGLNAAAVFLVTLRLLEAVPSAAKGPTAAAAAFGALLWAAHPLQTEMVASLGELAGLLSTTFFLLSLLAYLRGVAGQIRPGKRRLWLAVSWLAFAASALSRWRGVSLPLVLVLLDVYPLRRLDADPAGWTRPGQRHVWLEKAPFLATSLLLAALNAKAKLSLSIAAPVFWPEEAASRVIFYLLKLAAPVDLSPSYYTFGIAARHPWFGPNMLAVLGLSLWLWLRRRGAPAALAAWAAYLAALLPTLGSAIGGNVVIADHYAYVASLGAAPLAAGLLLRLWRQAGARRLAAGLAALSALAVFARLSWLQAARWRDPQRLWTYALAVEPDGFLANLEAGVDLTEEGPVDRAIGLLEAQPRGESGGRNADYLDDLRAWRRRLGADPAARENAAGAALFSEGRYAEAIGRFERAAGLSSRPTARRNLALAHLRLSQWEAAVPEYQEALALSARGADSDAERGLCLASLRRLPRGLLHFSHALAPDRARALAHDARGRSLLSEGRLDEAIDEFRSAVAEAPEEASARENLVTALALRGLPRAGAGAAR